MFILKSKEQLQKAINKARSIKPRARVLGFGLYEVEGSKGDAYQVRCKRDRLGNKTVGCNCAAGQIGKVCYHAAIAVGAHMALAEQRAH